jgi:hypothetical protein
MKKKLKKRNGDGGGQMELTFKKFVYQVLVEGSLVIVLDDFEMAKRFAKEHYTAATILPVPVFEYKARAEKV